MTNKDSEDYEVLKYIQRQRQFWVKLSSLYPTDQYYPRLLYLCEEIATRIGKNQAYPAHLLRLLLLEKEETERSKREFMAKAGQRARSRSRQNRGMVKDLREFIIGAILDSIKQEQRGAQLATLVHFVGAKLRQLPKTLSAEQLERFNQRQIARRRPLVHSKTNADEIYSRLLKQFPRVTLKTLHRAIAAVKTPLHGE